MSKFGGWSAVTQITGEEKQIFFEVRPMIEKMAKTEFKIYIPMVYSSQGVAGMNYMVKVLVDAGGDGVCVDALIFQALPCDGGKLSVNEIKYPAPIYVPLKPMKDKK